MLTSKILMGIIIVIVKQVNHCKFVGKTLDPRGF